MIQILLVHNRFHLLQPITWLSYFIRVFTCSKWNHLAIMVQDATGTWVIESIGQGVTIKPVAEWLTHADRIVLPLTPRKEVDASEVLRLKGKPYGFLDLVQILRHIKATRWDGKPKWEGKNYKGYLCSELGCLLMGFDAFLTPADFEYLPEHFTKGAEFTTTKTK